MDQISVYIHWPFCLSKCSYCSFNSIVSDASVYKACIDKIINDINECEYLLDEKNLVSIFFGGGTPSLIRAIDIKKIISNILSKSKSTVDVEISIEANPETLNKENVRSLKESGINRISIGIQSFIDEELNFLGRKCNAYQNIKALEYVSNEFDNFNIDLIYGFSLQTVDMLRRNICRAMDFSPRHISYYKLTFEEYAPIYKLRHMDIDENFDAYLFQLIEYELLQHGIYKYEVSNFAKSGYECTHNLSYWNYHDYIGIGAGAHGRVTINGSKYAIENIADPYKWLKSKIKYIKLSDTEVMQETIIMGLRTIYGANLANIKKDIIKNFIASENFKMLIHNSVINMNGTVIKINKLHEAVTDYIVSQLLNEKVYP